ncbi:hypothetical protein [Streptomyces uncialis]|uniref:hypothetical protein n=1 Tax=Streptomyces uncialis TaxID=1048205 RepID=UPI000AB946FA|nr:hypothetical protein [Streptomyces uncialis]MCX4658397.1 hypothetical protein [Streptomyces uncialis]WST66679.1 hypothetical protein OG268_03570 [Streptomyces uncialis]WTE14699.1 hypothetical protein OG924_33400 [Streptomyces uncialis]
MTVRRLSLALVGLVASAALVGAASQLAKMVVPDDRPASSVSAMNKAELVG